MGSEEGEGGEYIHKHDFHRSVSRRNRRIVLPWSYK